MSRRVVFDQVWKEFNRGERHDSLRDLIPAAVRRVLGRPARPERGTEAQEPRSRDHFWALRDVSFDVGEGEAFGIIGSNGAGKSTVLKLLTNILKPTRGSAALFGRVGALIEVSGGFHPDLTGRENVFLQGAIMGMSRKEIAAAFDGIVSFAGLERFIDTPVKRYSSGMNARLGFSIAAHLNPDVLLVDEVLAVGDLAFQEKCHARMKSFLKDGVTIVFVSHHLPAVARLCSQTLLLDKGRTVAIGPPTEVIPQYCSGLNASQDDEVAIAARLGSGSHSSRRESFDVEPGEELTLQVDLTFGVDVQRATIGVVVWDVSRELYVYGASSDRAGIPPIEASAGEHRSFTFSLRANLTRGLYALEINIVDPDRHRFLAVARGIRHFRVVEQVSYDGVANLYLSGFEGVDEVRAAC